MHKYFLRHPPSPHNPLWGNCRRWKVEKIVRKQGLLISICVCDDGSLTKNDSERSSSSREISLLSWNDPEINVKKEIIRLVILPVFRHFFIVVVFLMRLKKKKKLLGISETDHFGVPTRENSAPETLQECMDRL